MPDPWHGYVKICGVTSLEDATMVAASRASALGLIFAESPRQISRSDAREIVRATDGQLLRCAVFRHDDDALVLDVLDDLGVEIVQLHGVLGEELLAALRRRPVRVIKAIAIDDEEFDTFDESMVDAVLIDGPQPGSGEAHSWERLATRSFDVPVIAAGGLTPDNVEEVVRTTGAAGVDCASGVEAFARKKDPELVARFVQRAKRALAHAGAS